MNMKMSGEITKNIRRRNSRGMVLKIPGSSTNFFQKSEINYWEFSCKTPVGTFGRFARVTSGKSRWKTGIVVKIPA